MRDLLFVVNRNAGIPLQEQLRCSLVAAILEGEIGPGTPLPSSRHLARRLGIARNTVALTYQNLVRDGFLLARERSGYFVNSEILGGRVDAPRPKPPTARDFPSWPSRFRVSPSKQRNVVKRPDWQNFSYPFIYNQFDPALFPLADWRECSRLALGVGAVREWIADSINQDDPTLVEQIRSRLLTRRGIHVGPDQILVTVGAQHAIYLIASLLIKETSVVGLEDPGYADARNIFALRTGRLVGLPVDGSGLVPVPEIDGCDYVYVTPSHQFPTTVTLPRGRREELLARAAAADFVIIEDDYECEIKYDYGSPTPALKSLDQDDRVIYVSSLSKTLAPGLRIGYMVGPPELISEARALRRLMLRHPPTNNQRTAALFISRGHHDSLARRIDHVLSHRWQVMARALDLHLSFCRRSTTPGGSGFWLECPPGFDTRRLEAAAADRDVLIEPGDVFFLSDPAPRNFMRLAFSSLPAEAIEPGIRILSELMGEMRRSLRA